MFKTRDLCRAIENALKPAKFIIVLILMALAPAGVAQAQGRGFDSPTLRLQAKADELYRSGHWERAYFIYVNELAAVGDKYSQYMAGYMCLNGKGVSRDEIRASAWYRLAAERDGEEFVAVRDQLLESMSEEDREASDELFVALRKRYSDLVLMLGLLEKEREALAEHATGSRLSANSAAVTIIDPHTGTTITRSEYVGRLEKQMQTKLDYIAGKLDIEPLEPDMSDREFESLIERVDAYLGAINDR